MEKLDLKRLCQLKTLSLIEKIFENSEYSAILFTGNSHIKQISKVAGMIYCFTQTGTRVAGTSLYEYEKIAIIKSLKEGNFHVYKFIDGKHKKIKMEIDG